MKQFITAIILSTLISSYNAFGMDLAAKLSALKEEEMSFTTLLKAELTQSDASRWPQIKPLAKKAGLFLSIHENFAFELLDLNAEKKLCYESWLNAITQYKELLPTPDPIVDETEAPPLPPLPEINFTQPAKEQVTAAKKKTKKKKAKKQLQAAIPVTKITSKAKQPKKTPAKPKIKAIDTTHSDLFWSALLENDTNAVCALLTQKSIDIEAAHPSGKHSPLISAATAGNIPMCNLLLNHGAKADATTTVKLSNKGGFIKITALSVAIKSGNVELARALLARKANPNIPTVRIPSRLTETALDAATKATYDQENKTAMIKLLLIHGATEFSGKLLFYDTVLNKGYEVELSNPECKDLLPSLLEGTDKIVCRDGNISLFGSPILNKNLPEEDDSTEKLAGTQDATLSNEDSALSEQVE